MTVDYMKINRNMHEDSLLTSGEVAGLLGIHRNTVRRWSDMGLLRSFRVTKRGERRYKYGDISSFIDGMNGPDSAEF